jgi:hypothetical protein
VYPCRALTVPQMPQTHLECMTLHSGTLLITPHSPLRAESRQRRGHTRFTSDDTTFERVMSPIPSTESPPPPPPRSRTRSTLDDTLGLTAASGAAMVRQSPVAMSGSASHLTHRRGCQARIVVDPRSHRYESVVFASTSLSVSLQLDKLVVCRDKALAMPECRYSGLRNMKPSTLITRYTSTCFAVTRP